MSINRIRRVMQRIRVTQSIVELAQPQCIVLVGVVCLCMAAIPVLGVHRKAYVVKPPVTHVDPVVAPLHLKPPTDIPNCAVDACLALSFDDGPNPITTPQLLTILEHQQVPASFFIVGSRVSGNEALLRRMYADGDVIGNHSWDHADFTKLSPDQIRAEVNKTQSAIMGAGVPAPRDIRPPYGAVDAKVQSQLQLTIVRWNIDPDDWTTNNTAQIAQHIMDQAKPGGVLLLHDIYQSSVDALDIALPNLKSRFKLVTVDELFNLSGGDAGPYFGR